MQNLLIYFWAFSILAIFIGRWLVHRIDGRKYFTTPSPTQLNTYEIAALREERKGVIHTALFNLWNAKLIEISPEKRKSISFSLKNAKLIKVSGEDRDAEVKITSSNNLAPKNTVEAILYHFIAEQPRKPKEFFYQDSFHQQMDTELETTYQKLEKLHLRRTTEQLENMKKIPKMVLWLILGIAIVNVILLSNGSMFLLFSLILLYIILSTVYYRMSVLGNQYLKKLTKHFEEVSFAQWIIGAVCLIALFRIIQILSDEAALLIFSLAPLFIILKITFSSMSYRMSVLGKRHLKELKTHFERVKIEEHKDFDPALRVAIFGISGLIGFEMFSVFQEAFIYGSASSYDISGGGCGCGGGCGGGSDGSSGGCGGCGGGGGD